MVVLVNSLSIDSYKSYQQMNDLDILITREVEIKINKWSNDVILADGDENMFFRFCLNLVSEESKSNISIEVIDEYHADINITTLPNSIAKSSGPMEIGTYGADNRKLYIGFSVTPPIVIGETDYVIKITFYIEGNNGTK